MRLAIKLMAGVGCAILAVPLLAVGVIAAADTGALNGFIAKAFTASTQRSLTFRRMDLHLLQPRPTIVVDGLEIGSPPTIAPYPLAHLGHGEIAVRFWPLLTGRVVMTDVVVSNLDLRLARLGHDRNNYSFGHGAGGGLSVALHEVGRLVVGGDSRVRYYDPQRQLTLDAKAHYDSAAGALPLTLTGGGVDHGAGFTVAAEGAPLTGRTRDQTYAFKAQLVDGDAHVMLAGVSGKPFDFRDFDVAMDAAGPNIAALGYLFNVSAPNSPPFTLKAQATHKDHVLTFAGLQGRFGQSDVAGSFRSDHGGPRRAFALSLTSRSLRAEDVAAFLAARPSHADARILAGAGSVRPSGAAADHRGVDLAKLRTFDAALDLTAARVSGYALPLSNVRTRLRLADGRLVLDPLEASVGSGALTVKAVVEDRPDHLAGRIDAALRGAQLDQLAPAAKQVGGRLDATVHLSATGPSPQDLAARASGRVALRLQDGRLNRTQAAAIAGDPLGAAWAQVTDKSGEVQLRCVHGAFDLRSGVLTSSVLKIESGAGDASAHGSIDLGSKRIDFTFSPVSGSRAPLLKAPLHISGDLAHPKADVAVGRAVGRAGLGLIGSLITAPFRGPPAPAPAPCPAPG